MTDSIFDRHPALPYVAPMAGFLLLTTAEGYLPANYGQSRVTWYPLLYTMKVVLVAGLAWYCRRSWRDLAPRPSGRSLALSMIIGLLVALAWVGLNGRYPALSFLGSRTAFNPDRLSALARWGFIVERLFGLVILVPLIEELFWRSFAMRLVIEAEFDTVPVGRVTPVAAVVTSVLFGFAHPEWLPGLLTGFAWSWLLWKTKSVSACLVSHVVANLALGSYVISTKDWQYW